VLDPVKHHQAATHLGDDTQQAHGHAREAEEGGVLFGGQLQDTLLKRGG
jgi:hypothetical protein